MSSFGRRFFRHIHTTYPRTTNSIVYGAICGVGDILAQRIDQDPNHEYSFGRTARMMMFGGLCAGPLYAWWYPKLEVLTHRYRHSRRKRVVAKVLWDQVVFEPPALMAFYFITGTMEGESMNDITRRVKRDYMPTYAADWMFWPAYQAINFTFVPVKYQTIVVGGGSVLWLAFLSWMKHREITNDDGADNDGDGDGGVHLTQL